jgi:hypothetical protein
MAYPLITKFPKKKENMLLADTGSDVLALKLHGGWKSSSVAEGNVETIFDYHQ